MSKEKIDKENNMILVEAGRFEMGRKSYTKLVTISKDFYICKFPVTFDEYDDYCKEERKDKPDDVGWGRGNRPFTYLTWYDAIEYCNWKSKKEELEEVYTIDKSVKDINNENEDKLDKFKRTVSCNFNKNGYRLPTEAEWEFAAKGGNKSIEDYLYSGSNDIEEVAWYIDNSVDKMQPVGQKKSNELGIYDMSGNVDEWCWDWYIDNNSDVYDPKGANTGLCRVLRGGSWDFIANYCEVANRDYSTPSYSSNFIGFRVSRTC